MSRRIDNQLRGRAGRQGDPGSTQFIISLQDPLFQQELGGTSFELASSLMNDEGVAVPALTAQVDIYLPHSVHIGFRVKGIGLELKVRIPGSGISVGMFET